jgi:hypothetical protein
MTERHLRWVGAAILLLAIVIGSQYVRAAGPHGAGTTTTSDTSPQDLITFPVGP